MVKDEPVKDQNGFCLRVERGKRLNRFYELHLKDFCTSLSFICIAIPGLLFSGETGLLLSKVCAVSPFFGYAGSKQLTEKKLMKDVFVKGDAYFNTGDLMMEDHEGFICFRDRVGDTFRYALRRCLKMQRLFRASLSL